MGQQGQNVRNAIECSAPSGPQKQIKNECDGFHNVGDVLQVPSSQL